MVNPRWESRPGYLTNSLPPYFFDCFRVHVLEVISFFFIPFLGNAVRPVEREHPCSPPESVCSLINEEESFRSPLNLR